MHQNFLGGKGRKKLHNFWRSQRPQFLCGKSLFEQKQIKYETDARNLRFNFNFNFKIFIIPKYTKIH